MNSESTKILLVEDNPVDVLVIRDELSRLSGNSYMLFTAGSLAEAQAILERESIDVVLLDLVLPDGSGLETFFALQLTAPDVPVVVMSGLDDESVAVEAVREGAQDYLVKGKCDGLALSRSITYAIERQQLIVRLRNAEKSLRQSEERFRAIFEGAQDAIYIQDCDSRLTHVNPATSRIFGRPARELVGKRDETLFGLDAAKQIRNINDRVLAGETVEEERMVSLADARRVFSTYKVPLRDGSGRIIGLCGISRDVTERKRAELPAYEQIDEYPSPAMKHALRLTNIAAQKESIILLQGESGAGKDYLAKYIHERSRRASGPYFSLNCAAIVAQLAESELFGHEKGSFTGAHGKKRGLLELAEGGTLLLNEIGELPMRLQAKLLTFLDTRKYTRVGGEREIPVNTRLIVATNRNLEQEVEEGRFRKDLFFRINVFSITIPPLRERREDLPALVQNLLARLRQELRVPHPEIDDATMRQLQSYHWPGNVRELRNVLERAIILSDGKKISVAGLGLGQAQECNPLDEEWRFVASFPQERTLNDVTHDLKRSLVIEALRRSNGSKQGAARLLGISRYSLKHYMKHLGIADED
jgi:PAS domain S-box-containing protein